jgi:hypothetical protein
MPQKQPEEQKKLTSVIKPCPNGSKCVSLYQDKKHGPGKRVHTVGKDGAERCTVCGPGARWQQRLESCAKAWNPSHSFSKE